MLYHNHSYLILSHHSQSSPAHLTAKLKLLYSKLAASQFWAVSSEETIFGSKEPGLIIYCSSAVSQPLLSFDMG